MSIVKGIQGISAGLRALSLSSSFNAASKQEIALRKPVPPYIMFFQDYLKTQKNTSPEGLGQMAKSAGAQWQAMAEQKKAEYKALHEKKMAEYMAALDAMPKEQLEKMAQLEKEKRNQRKIFRLRKRLRELQTDRPARPLSAINLFSQENKQMFVGKRFSEGLGKVAWEEFKKLSPTKQQQLTDRAAKMKAEALVKQSAWSEKIKTDGRDEQIAELKRKIRELKNQ